MKKNQRRRGAKQPKSHNKRDRRPTRRRATSPHQLATAFLKSKAEAPPAHAKALQAAVPREIPLHSSSWLAQGTARAKKASGMSARAVIGLLGDFIRWCYRKGEVPQHDAALCVAQLELLRRKNGAEASVVQLPEPRGPGEMTLEQLRELVASWEAQSFAVGLGERGDEAEDYALLMTGAMELAQHLASADGVPIRLDRLDPAAFALDIDARESAEDVGPPPDGYLRCVLEGAALLYERCADRGYIPQEVDSTLGSQLSGLAMAYYQRERAA